MHLYLYPLALSLRNRAICFTQCYSCKRWLRSKSWVYKVIFAFALYCTFIVFHDHEKGWVELHAIFSDGVVFI